MFYVIKFVMLLYIEDVSSLNYDLIVPLYRKMYPLPTFLFIIFALFYSNSK